MNSEFWVTLLSSISTSTAVVWLIKSVISERLKNAIKSEYDLKLAAHTAEIKAKYDGELEVLKNKLKSETDLEVEKLRTALAITASEHQVKFTKLHHNQAEFIADLYACLKKFHVSVSEYIKPLETSGDKSKEDRRNEVVKRHQEFLECYDGKQIYISSDLVSLIDNLNYRYRYTYFNFFYEVESASEAKPNRKAWGEISMNFKAEIEPILQELEVEFRGILGVSNITTKLTSC